MAEPTAEQLMEWRLSPMGEWIAAQEQYIVELQEAAKALVTYAESAVETIAYFVESFYGEDGQPPTDSLVRVIHEMKAVLP